MCMCVCVYARERGEWGRINLIVCKVTSNIILLLYIRRLTIENAAQCVSSTLYNPIIIYREIL